MTHALPDDWNVILGVTLLGAGTTGVIYTYIGYPLVLWIISRFFRSPQSRRSVEPQITMIIAAHNEESCIHEKLEATLALNYPREKLQIVVASDGSTDRTNEIVTRYADRGVELIDVNVRRGKTNAQNVAVLHARNPILVFSDATTIYDPDALQYLAACYMDPNVGAASGRYDYFDRTDGSPTASGSAKLWGLENLIKRMQSRICTLTGCCGCIYSVRRDLYTRLDPEIISDLVQPLHVLVKGARIVFQEHAHAWEESTRTTQDEFRMRVRVATRGMRGLLSIPELLFPWKHPWVALQLWSHKIFRWCIPIFLLSCLAGNALLARFSPFQIWLAVQIAFYSCALAALLLPCMRRSRLLGLPLYFCTINSAFVVGMFNMLVGRKFNVWQPTRG